MLVWRGAALGLGLGFIVGFYRANYWETVLAGLIGGAVVGVAYNWVVIVSSLVLRARGEEP